MFPGLVEWLMTQQNPISMREIGRRFAISPPGTLPEIGSIAFGELYSLAASIRELVDGGHLRSAYKLMRADGTLLTEDYAEPGLIASSVVSVVYTTPKLFEYHQ